MPGTLNQRKKADALRPRHERRSARALHAEVQAFGYDGDYTRLTDYIRAWRGEQGKASVTSGFVPLSFDHSTDTAAEYGMGSSEALLGRFVRQLPRSDVVLSTEYKAPCRASTA